MRIRADIREQGSDTPVDFIPQGPLFLQFFTEQAIFFTHLGNQILRGVQLHIFIAQGLYFLQKTRDAEFEAIEKFHAANLYSLGSDDKMSGATSRPGSAFFLPANFAGNEGYYARPRHGELDSWPEIQHNARLNTLRALSPRGASMFFGWEEGFDYVGHLMRPPSEHDSILIQATVGCSHNRCSFCSAYRDKRLFRIKDPSIISKDLEYAKRHCRHMNRVFLMDGDALIIPQKRLVWILEQIREHLPWVTRVGLYANAKGVRMKSDEELRILRELGLGIAYLGVESGDDVTLRRINKGADSATLIDQGKRLEAAGIAASITVLLGIAGPERSLEHARETGRVLTAMNPSYVGALSVIVTPGTPLHDEMQRGEFQVPGPYDILRELREMVRCTELSHGLFMSNHASNYLPLKIQYPGGKEGALRAIDGALDGQISLRPERYRAL